MAPEQAHVPPAESVHSEQTSASNEGGEVVDEAPQEHQPIIDRLDKKFGGRLDLEPALRRRHIIMISIGGTIGMGLVLSSSRILHTSGSTGLIVSYSLVGAVVAAVMSCIAEMVSLIPEPGALALFPARFIDRSLGFTVGISYWFSTAMSLATLTTATTVLTTYWSRDVLDLDTGWRITIFLILFITVNILGVKTYAELEHFFAWLKIAMILGLTITSLAISSGANKDHVYYGTRYWRNEFTIPPNYNGNTNLDGATGRFLSIWDGFTTAAFAYAGVEIVAMTAGEAKYPRTDIPFAAKYVWRITIFLYVSSVIFVSLCVPWTNPKLINGDLATTAYTGAVSPFIIAMSEAGYAVLPGLTNAGYVFAAWTAANTYLYVASRVLYGMCQGMTPEDHPILYPLGRTRRKNGAPVMAILASCIFVPLAYLLCSTSNYERLLDVFSRMCTTSVLMVWGSQCLSFLRFYYGLEHSIYDRSLDSYPFRSKFQPFTAIFGLSACSLLVIFNGWASFLSPFTAADFIGAYLWPLLFFCIYFTHKFLTKSEIKPLEELEYQAYFASGRTEPPPEGVLKSLFELRQPKRRPKQEPLGMVPYPA
ncbi:MAG: hypothetical protein M1829_002226 [Trizodia sp. TS-e1964]|nr:MAG: hypothetical protein M1829_002226 [Trizodia sp. TS-e1964]